MQQEYQNQRLSNLMRTYGCSRSNNITIFFEEGYHKYHGDTLHLILKSLENDPCNRLHYTYTSRKIVQWKGEDKHDIRADMFKQLTDSEQREFQRLQTDFVDNLLQRSKRQQHVKNEGHNHQVLLLFHASFIEHGIDKAIRELQENTDWTVILICPLFCLLYEGIPPNQVVPFTSEAVQHVADLVRNPTFNKFKVLRYTKLRHANLACMSNVTVHFSYDICNFGLLERVAILFANTRNNSKIAFESHGLYWPRFIEYSFRDYDNVLLEKENRLALTIKTNQVFLTNIKLPKDVLCRPGTRKHVIFYMAPPRNGNIITSLNHTEYYKSIQKSCSMEFHELTIKTDFPFSRLSRDFINEVVNAACFVSNP